MFVRCVLVLIMSVALGQTLKCYNCDPSDKDEQLSSGPCKDSELGELVDCDGVCFKEIKGRWYFFPSCFTITRFYKTMITIIIYLFIDDENKTISRGCYKKKDEENGCKTSKSGVTDCYCDMDKCNGATEKWISTTLMILLFVTMRM